MADEADPKPTVRGPQGSRYEDQQEPKRTPRTLKRRLRRMVTVPLIALFARVFPYLYYAYCWIVWKTSLVDSDRFTRRLVHGIDTHGRFVALLWHQEVFTVAYGYKHLYGHTLASTGNFGRIITGMLELCNFQVFRGGSSRGRARKRRVLLDMIRHMQREPRVPYGITVDGSHGPVYRMKKGGPVIAKVCRSPIFLVRTWYSRKIQLPSWDRTAIPLPLGRIRMEAIGPYWIDPECSDAEFDAAWKHLEADLLELAEQSMRWFGPRHLRPKAPEGFPAGWAPRWAPGQMGIPLGPHDLRPEDPPPYAHRAGEAPSA